MTCALALRAQHAALCQATACCDPMGPQCTGRAYICFQLEVGAPGQAKLCGICLQLLQAAVMCLLPLKCKWLVRVQSPRLNALV